MVKLVKLANLDPEETTELLVILVTTGNDE